MIRTKILREFRSLASPFRRAGLVLALTLSASACGSSGGAHDGKQPAASACSGPAPEPASSSFYDGMSFLFQGTCATQVGVDPLAFTRARAAVLRGRVLDDAGKALQGVTVSAPQEPTWGTTTTAADGGYAFAVQGGGKSILRFELAGHLASQRGVVVGWNRVAVVDDVTLIQPSGKTSALELGGGSGWQTATGDLIEDSSGKRTLRVLFPPGVHATTVAADGTESSLSHGTLRLTEYTRGERGPSTMPAGLPPTSAYTYASAFSFDEAAGAKQVRFDQPVYAYVDNFLQMNVGTSVPAGAYRPEGDAWDAGPSGVVVAVVDAGDKLGLDVDGDGQADSGEALDALAITPDEIAALTAFANAGESFWRAPLLHFSSVDFNWGVVPPDGAGPGTGGSPTGGTKTGKPCIESGASKFECENQVLHDDIALSGTAMGLHYASDRAAGRLAEFALTIPVTGDTLPGHVKRATVDVDVLGELTHTDYARVAKHLTNSFTWDGKDAWGRTWHGRTTAHVRVSMVYDGLAYSNTPHFGQVPDGTRVSQGATRSEIVFVTSYELPIGLWDATELGLGGWTLTGHHVYDPETQMLYRGDGGERSAASIPALAESFAGQAEAGFSGDGGPAAAALLEQAEGIAVLPDGSVIVSDLINHRLRKIDAAGVISTFAGTGRDAVAGDGGPALRADISARVGWRRRPTEPFASPTRWAWKRGCAASIRQERSAPCWAAARTGPAWMTTWRALISRSFRCSIYNSLSRQMARSSSTTAACSCSARTAG